MITGNILEHPFWSKARNLVKKPSSDRAGLNRYSIMITTCSVHLPSIMTMPGMTGVELIQELIQIRPDMPIILCSGYSSIATEEEALAAGANAFCMKPVDLETICGIVRTVLDAD